MELNKEKRSKVECGFKAKNAKKRGNANVNGCEMKMGEKKKRISY